MNGTDPGKSCSVWRGCCFGETDDDGDVSFREIYELSFQFATLLDSNGLRKGESILVVLPNSRWYPVLFLGAALIGCPLSGINQDSTADEISYYADQSGAVAAVCTEGNFTRIKGILKVLKIFVFCSEEKYHQFSDAVSLPRYLPLWDSSLPSLFDGIHHEPDDTLLMPFSSGTGGKPRCVMLTHRNYSAATAILKMALFDQLVVESQRKTIALLPFYHASGFWALLYCLLEGCHSIILESFHPISMLEIIHKYKVDTLNVVPSILSFLCRMNTDCYDLSSVRTVLCGSSPLGKELCSCFLEKFPSVQNLIQGFGMTEVVVLSHITPLGLIDEKHLGSCGKLLPGFEAELRDENGDVINRPNCPGELFLKSPTVMSGYYESDEAAEAFHDGWLRTGDVLYYDEDGYYYVVDRVKDLIKVNGMQVSPSELEDIILMDPWVREVAVIGIEHPKSGQVPKAFVVLGEGVNRDVAKNRIISIVKARLAPYKQLRGGIEIVEMLPKTSSGKIKRCELRASMK
nr:AMP-dependent synthetase ligase domain containing protein [Haemonchus contortus]